MTKLWNSPWRIKAGARFELANAATHPTDELLKNTRCKRGLKQRTQDLYQLQRKLYADDRHSVLLVFQAMDAAGKDSTIRHVFAGVNPAGFQVTSFKQPSKLELDHDFLWRVNQALPERGRIGIFNRSHYEETLVVRVHPEYLGGQRLPEMPDLETLWQQRFEDIRNWEQHLARNGTVVIKFFLNVSRNEQHRRFARRIDEVESNWKFSAGDLKESARWGDYMAAYQDVLNETSTADAPWYVIPADHKPFMRYTVADIVARHLEALELEWPSVSEKEREEMLACKDQLVL